MIDDSCVPVSWRELRAAQEFLEVPTDQLWLDYVALGGSSLLYEVARWLQGQAAIPARDYDYLAIALNERFMERGLGQPLRDAGGSYAPTAYQ